MKDEAIKKINKFGSIGSVVVTVLKVLVAVLIVLSLLSCFLFFFIPKDSMSFEISDQLTMHVNGDSFSKDGKLFLSEEDKNTFKEEFTGSMFKSSKGDYDVQSITFPTDNSVEVDMKIGKYSFDFSKVQIVMIISSLFFAAVLVTLVFVGKFCKQLKICETPFAEPVIKSMKHMAISLIPYVISDCVMGSITNSFLTNKAVFSFDINVGMLAAVILIFAMTFVFKYGAKLQQESDETL